MPLNKTTFTSLLVFAGVLFSAPMASATEMVYVPVNPNFGGSPLNGSMLLNNAQAQDRHKDPDAGGSAAAAGGSSLNDFNQMLQRSILSRISSAATSSIVGAGGALVPGTVETTDFTITIADQGGGALRVTTTDKITGQSTSFQIGQ